MQLRELLARLVEHQVRFSVIGGVAASSELEIAGTRLLVLTLDGLEVAKRASGRPKDLVDLGYILALKRQSI